MYLIREVAESLDVLRLRVTSNVQITISAMIAPSPMDVEEFAMGDETDQTKFDQAVMGTFLMSPKRIGTKFDQTQPTVPFQTT